jgi:hypothetical protein
MRRLTDSIKIKEYMLLYKERSRQRRKKAKYWRYSKRKNYMKNYWRTYKRKRYKHDINYKIICLSRSRIINALKKNQKSIRTVELVSCPIAYLKAYIEKQFKTGMSWKNWSINGWHLDHKIPCSKFDLSKISEQKKCFHYSNLQPLWAKKRRQKTVREKKGR